MPFLPSFTTRRVMSINRTPTDRGIFGMPPYKHNWDVERVVTDGYERVIWVFRGVDAIASSASRLPVVLRKGDAADGQRVAYERLEYLLNKKANRYETGQAFRYRLSTQLMLSKKGVFIYVKETRSGDPYSLELLPPHRVQIIPDPVTFIRAFELTHGEGEKEWLYPYRKGEGEGVIWIRNPHPLDPYSGTTPLEAAGLSIDTDYYARLFNRNFLKNDGRPGGLIAINGEIGDDDARELKRRYSGGPETAGRVSVIEADGLNWVDTATSPRDAQYVESRGLTKEDILLALGTPESVIGNASGRTYDNADAEHYNFWTITMPPHLGIIESGFDELTEGGVEDDIFVAHNTEGISVLRRDERERHAKLLVELEAGAITIDEYREGTGRRAWGDVMTRSLWKNGAPIAVDPMEEEPNAVIDYRDAYAELKARQSIIEHHFPELEEKHPGHPDQGVHNPHGGRGKGEEGDDGKKPKRPKGAKKPKSTEDDVPEETGRTRTRGTTAGKEPEEGVTRASGTRTTGEEDMRFGGVTQRDFANMPKKPEGYRVSNFFNHKTGEWMNLTQAGDFGEDIVKLGPVGKAVAKKFGGGKLVAEARADKKKGKGARNTPHDFSNKSYVMEVKTVSSLNARANQKMTSKKPEKARKHNQARATGKEPMSIFQVVDMQSGRIKVWAAKGTTKGVNGGKEDYIPSLSVASSEHYVGEYDVQALVGKLLDL